MPPDDAAAEVGDTTTDATVLDLLALLLRRRRMIIGIALLVVLAADLVPLTRLVLGRRVYASEALLTASARRSKSELSGIAAQFGLASPGGDPTQSPSFFVDLLRSHQVLSRLAATTVQPATGGSVSLAEHMDLVRGDSARQIEAVRKALAEVITASASSKSGILTIRAEDRDARVARQLIVRLLDLLAEANLDTRRSQASAERRFTEARMAESVQELRKAEERLREFLQRNRDIRTSPLLELEHDRMQRDVSMRQQIYTTLAQAFEQARIEEVRDTPVISIVQAPFLPARPEPTGIIANTVIALLCGLGLGALAAFLLEVASGLRTADADRYASLQSLAQAFWQDVRRPWRLLRSR